MAVKNYICNRVYFLVEFQMQNLRCHAFFTSLGDVSLDHLSFFSSSFRVRASDGPKNFDHLNYFQPITAFILYSGLELIPGWLTRVPRVPGTCRNYEHQLWHRHILTFLIQMAPAELILCNEWHPQFQIPNSSPVIGWKNCKLRSFETQPCCMGAADVDRWHINCDQGAIISLRTPR